jgi:hypothetical protein
MTLVTEAQKKQITILLVAFLSILIYITGIRPMDSKIEENEIRLTEVEEQRQQMQLVVDNRNIIPEYEKLRNEYEMKFQQRFENFESNEKIEAIIKEFNMPILGISISDFEPVNKSIYENYIAQPKDQAELNEVKSYENTPVFSLLLCSTVKLTIEIQGLEEELKMYDVFNNIVPIGPGDADEDRYCLLIPKMSLSNLKKTTQNSSTASGPMSYTILVFAMETMDLSSWDAEFEARKQGSAS